MRMYFINDNRRYVGKKTITGWAKAGRLIVGSFTFSYSLFAHFCDIGFDVNDEDATFNICIPYIISLWFSTTLIRGRGNKELSIKIHDWSIWWNLWTSNMEWSNKTPKWRMGSFDILRFLFGKNEYKREVIEERDVLIPMPEGNYEAHIKLCKDTWKRPRGFLKTILRIDADIPKGIPHAGKGESSWDCGDDATYGVCCMANSIVEGVGEIVKDGLKTRVKNGGWNDYKWFRENKT